jgi:hypothetical protein
MKTSRILVLSLLTALFTPARAAEIVRGGDLVSALLAGQIEVVVKDIDAGFKEIQLEYRRGSAPTGYPKKLKVKAARNSDLWRSIGIMGVVDNQEKFLAGCLENFKSTTDLLERVTPECYGKILYSAFDLTFGINWREKLQLDAKSH